MELFGRSERLHVWLLERTQQSAWPGLRHAETVLMSAPSKELKPFFSPGEPAVNRWLAIDGCTIFSGSMRVLHSHLLGGHFRSHQDAP